MGSNVILEEMYDGYQLVHQKQAHNSHFWIRASYYLVARTAFQRSRSYKNWEYQLLCNLHHCIVSSYFLYIETLTKSSTTDMLRKIEMLYNIWWGLIKKTQHWDGRADCETTVKVVKQSWFRILFCHHRRKAKFDNYNSQKWNRVM